MKTKKTDHKPFSPKTKVGSVIICIILLVPIVSFCIFSFADKDVEKSKDEKRVLKQKPRFSVESLLNGKLTGEFNDYYTDQFPFREFFISVNLKTKEFLTQYPGKDGVVLLEGAGNDDLQGEEAGNE